MSHHNEKPGTQVTSEDAPKDPVLECDNCSEKYSASQMEHHVTKDTGRYTFCSDVCKTQFQEN